MKIETLTIFSIFATSKKPTKFQNGDYIKQCLKTDYFLSFVAVGYGQPLPGKPERQTKSKHSGHFH